MTLGYRGTLMLLALPFTAYAVASAVAAYRPIVGMSLPKGPPLNSAEDYAKLRERSARIAAGASNVGQLAFTGTGEPADTLPDDLRKMARGISERNQVWENVRMFETDPMAAKFKGPLAKAFEEAK